jgi:hypothetical protein
MRTAHLFHTLTRPCESTPNIGALALSMSDRESMALPSSPFSRHIGIMISLYFQCQLLIQLLESVMPTIIMVRVRSCQYNHLAGGDI